MHISLGEVSLLSTNSIAQKMKERQGFPYFLKMVFPWV